ncbi:zinc-binding dehydrogenase [Pontibacillus yanchengensis]
MNLFASKKVYLPIEKVFDLRDAASAHKLMESRNYEGKVLLKI